MKRAFGFLMLVGLALAGFTATAFAAGQVTPDGGSLLDHAKPVMDAIMHGQAWLAASLAVVFLCAATRKYLPDQYGGKFARGDVGGVLLAFLMAFAGAVATALTAGGAMSTALALTALKVGLGAAGGYTVLHKLATALVATKWYQDKMPAPVKAVVAFVLSLIGSSAAARAKVVAKAEKAGTDAVAKNPGKGADSVIGKPEEF